MGHKCHRDLWHWKTYSQRRCWLLLMYVQYVSICTFKGPILYFSSISHSRQRSNNSVFKTSCHKPIYGPEFQPSKSRSGELSWKQTPSLPAPWNAKDLPLSTPALPPTCPSHSVVSVGSVFVGLGRVFCPYCDKCPSELFGLTCTAWGHQRNSSATQSHPSCFKTQGRGTPAPPLLARAGSGQSD